MREVVAQHGLFCSLYTDRGSHYFETPEAGGRVSKTVLTQFGRALSSSASSTSRPTRLRPAAGRSACSARCRTGCRRSLRWPGSARWRRPIAGSREVYIADAQRAVRDRAEQEGSAFVTDATGAWREILCIQEERTVGNDNTVKWHRLSLQLPPSRLRPHFVKAKVRVHEYPDGQLAVFWGPHRLADYTANGRSFRPERQAA